MQFIKIDKEFQNILRPLTAEEFKSLENDIKENGCLRPVELWHGYIADGHNRYSICMKNNIPFEQADVTDKFETKSDVMKWIVQNQRARQTGRQLSNTELAAMAMVVEKQVAVEAKEQQIRKPISVSSNLNEQIEPIRTAAKAAESIGVSENTYRDMKLIMEKGSDAQIERMNNGGRGNGISTIAREIKAKEMPPMKCKKCGNEYPAELFYGHRKICKYCYNMGKRKSGKMYDVLGNVILDDGTYKDVSDESIIKNLYVNDVAEKISIKDVVEEFNVNLESCLRNLERTLSSHSDLVATHKQEISTMWNDATTKFIQMKERYV